MPKVYGYARVSHRNQVERNNSIPEQMERIQGYFDYRMKGEGFEHGFQSVPVDWGIRSARKRGFFKLLADLTGR